jgi:hypothetical protein
VRMRLQFRMGFDDTCKSISNYALYCQGDQDSRLRPNCVYGSSPWVDRLNRARRKFPFKVFESDGIRTVKPSVQQSRSISR